MLKSVSASARVTGSSSVIDPADTLLSSSMSSVLTARRPPNQQQADSSPSHLLARFLADHLSINAAFINRLMVNAQSDPAEISALAQLAIHGSLFRLLPSSFLDQGRKMLAALALSLEESGENHEAINTLLRLATIFAGSPTNDFATAIFLLERAHRICSGNAELKLLVGVRLGEARVRSGSWAPERLREQVEEVRQRRHTLSPRTTVQSLLRASDPLLGQIDEAHEWLKEAIAIASASGDLAGMVQGRLRLGSFLVGSRELALASRHLLEAEALQQVS